VVLNLKEKRSTTLPMTIHMKGKRRPSIRSSMGHFPKVFQEKTDLVH